MYRKASYAEPVQVNDYFIAEVNIFPNPANDVINMSLENNSKIISIQLFDVQGRMIYYEAGPPLDQYAISVKSLNAGVYIGAIVSENGNTYFVNFIKN
ncbi:MAG: T9SS type A sorting domain-containing protein [Bacteroidetes bacterium]|nr:T9SS type A sorting domain-containing protein [Bacteroidota bacterium]